MANTTNRLDELLTILNYEEATDFRIILGGGTYNCDVCNLEYVSIDKIGLLTFDSSNGENSIDFCPTCLSFFAKDIANLVESIKE